VGFRAPTSQTKSPDDRNLSPRPGQVYELVILPIVREDFGWGEALAARRKLQEEARKLLYSLEKPKTEVWLRIFQV
jgi:hypothetical protein